MAAQQDNLTPDEWNAPDSGTIFSALPVGALFAVRLEPGLPLLFANAAFSRSFPYEPEKTGWEEGEALLPFLLSARTCGRERCTLSFRRNTGEATRHFQASVSFLQGEPAGAVFELRDVTEEKTLSERLELMGRSMGMILDETDFFLFEYNLRSGEITLFKKAGENSAVREPYRAPSFASVRETMLHPDDLAEVLRAQEEIVSGAGNAVCQLRLRVSPGAPYRWYRVVLTAGGIYHKAASVALGIAINITRQKEMEQAFLQEEQYRQAMLSSMAAYAEINVTKNQIRKAAGAWETFSRPEAPLSYRDVLDFSSLFTIAPEDCERYQQVMSLENMCAAFAGGKRELFLEHRRFGPDGDLRWTELTIHLLRDPASGNLMALLYLRDINARKQQEMFLKDQASRDSLTRLYNRGTAERLIDAALKESRPGTKHALFLLDLDYFKEANDAFGHMYGDLILEKLGRNLRTAFRTDDICGRLGGDEMIAFLRDLPDPALAMQRGETLCAMVRGLMGADAGLSCSIGVACFPEDGTTYEALYRCADQALYAAKVAGRNRCVAFSTLGKEAERGNVPITDIDAPERTPAMHNIRKMVRQDETVVSLVQLLDELEDVVYISDPETYEIFYANRAFYNWCRTSANACVGKKCYQVIDGGKQPCAFCNNDRLSFQQYDVWTRLNPQTGRYFRIRDKLILWNGKRARLEIALPLEKCTQSLP